MRHPSKPFMFSEKRCNPSPNLNPATRLKHGGYTLPGTDLTVQQFHYDFPYRFRDTHFNFVSILENEGLPPDYPHHIDSIRAEHLSRKMTGFPSDTPCLPFLQEFRKGNIRTYGDNLAEAPAKYAYATARNRLVSPRFGVTAPRGGGRGGMALVDCVREYRRRRMGWQGPQRPHYHPEPYWEHGHCAESQALTEVVRQCEDLRLQEVEIETYAVGQDGAPASMCENCILYIRSAVLGRHPRWTVTDGTNGNRYQKKRHN
ncbi:hypothetical protein CC2G_002628 [Coprinopsis cinerea AmutBmut pab1-1]|nr:hypothetical protein CC2G_002628 [Coprinopsis cinerea AmutBmut pab1-1]